MVDNLDKVTWVKPTDDAAALYGDEESTKKPNKFLNFVSSTFDFLQSIALGGAFFVVFYLFIIQPHQVKGSSMYPTFKDKEYILTDKISYKFSLPKRGEVVILQSPQNPDIDYIKRVIGLPGEQVKIADGKVYVNNQALSESYLKDVTTTVFPGGFSQEGQTVTVPENNYFVMGDNRPGSSDSREFGFVPFTHIVGKVIFRYFPVDRFGAIAKANY